MSTRRRLAVLVPAAAVALAGGAVAAGVFDGELDQPDLVHCYAAADLGARVQTRLAQEGLRDAAEQTPAELCAPLWSRRVFTSTGEVPRLAACVRDGEAVVFPGGPGTCRRLELDQLPDAEFRDQGARRAELEEALFGLDLTGCTKGAQMRAAVEAVLARTGHTGWSVEIAARGNECITNLRGSFTKRLIELHAGEESVSELDEGADGFAYSAAGDGDVLSAAEVERMRAEHEREACKPRPRGVEVVTGFIECLEARRDGVECIPFETTRASVRELMRRELGDDWGLVVHGVERQERECLNGHGADQTLRQVTLFAGEG